ncbi:putative porin [Flavobacterium amniphilum]|uniref:putative porin n=1 Tax=Flavobacterium amniphilum TaxID=1834035 RepID=UPI002029E9FF|nr:putative porin [Flavobacterium amniphilum]MCL9807339.1 putative porin [Flavobacterium amniphilum]
MKKLLIISLFFMSFCGFAQDDELPIQKDTVRRSLRGKVSTLPKAAHNMYKIFSLEKDTVFVDTSLTIKSDYKFNYLRKDNFGVLPFNNDGQTYNTLDFGLNRFDVRPNFGFKAKYFNYYTVEDMKYYSVATPLTELYFKTTLEQGQSVDAFITLNTSKNLNMSIGYKGLRSLGKYINSLSSNGNFIFTTSYSTTSKRYVANLHFAGQDFLNNENGGLQNKADFESGDPEFQQRSRLEVNFDDASSIFKSKRYFVDHTFRINKNDLANTVLLDHQFNYETKSYDFRMTTETEKFGDAYVSSNYSDYTKSNDMYNRLGATFSNSTIGKFNVFIENYQYNYFYDRYSLSDDQVVIPNSIHNNLNAFGGKYFYDKNKIKGYGLFSKAISNQTFSKLELFARYEFDDKNSFTAMYQNLSKVPDLNYILYQSDFINYNWYNSFKNEKINNLKVSAKTQWLTVEVQLTTLNDHLYFSNDDVTGEKILVTPKQYGETINYFSVKAQKEFKFGKFAIDNTFLFQQTEQEAAILNVPKFVTRNTLYYTDKLFKKALFLQTGFTFQYFSKYNANAYNPLISEFYVQDTEKIGDFPLIDFFVNARVRQTRIFLKAEHLNSSFTGNKFYSAPNYPYKDFVIRFGLVWNFFQ